MLITQIITYIMAVFAAAGAIDRILGNRFGLGSKFEQAFHTMGPLALSMAGMLVIAPVIADILGPVMTPAFRLLGADPAVFAGMFMGTDMGAAPLAEALALDPRSADFSGFVISSMMGATIVFHIPVAMELAKESKPFIARGMIASLITIPLGCFLGGMAAGFPVSLVLHDLLPVAIVSLILMIPKTGVLSVHCFCYKHSPRRTGGCEIRSLDIYYFEKPFLRISLFSSI